MWNVLDAHVYRENYILFLTYLISKKEVEVSR